MPDRERAKRLLSRTEAADYLNMSVRSFDRLRLEITVPFVRLGRRRRYLVWDLEALIRNSRVVEGSDD